MTPADVARDADLGTASARKSGRDPRWPYVAVIVYDADKPDTKTYTKTLLGLAYATREEAVARAQREIDTHRADLARRLSDPRYRALRARYGIAESA